ncbi:DcrB-related protein [Sorangium sp. So ce117]|uniref:DcrB-related protein n=1 Tax=Sorangium sp. So ce117 TaxID=3133277 RepID=UPI003F601079
MPRYENSDVSFDVPRDWEDRSIVAFAASPEPGQASTASVVMTRDALAAGEDLRKYGDRQLMELAKRLEGFQLLARHERAVGDRPGLELRFAWRGQSGPLEQRLLFVAGRRPTVLSFTATLPRDEVERLDPMFDRIFASVRIAGSPEG